MKTILTALLIVLSANVSAWEPLPSLYGINQPSNLTTYGGDNIQTTTGRVQGQDVNLQTYGSDTFSTTFGTVGGRRVDCHSYGSGNFRTTNCN